MVEKEDIFLPRPEDIFHPIDSANLAAVAK